MIGGSSGALEVLRQMLGGLPKDFPASIFIVVHVPRESPSNLPAILSRSSALKVSHPRDDEPIRAGHVYIAPPDYHMLLHQDRVRIVRGPRENRSRPAIDPLFRSAVRAYDGRVAGVIVSGVLDDGSDGLHLVKSAGGLAIVQEPDDAAFGDMPRNALEYTKADYVVPAAELAATLLRVVGEPAKSRNGRPAPINRPGNRPVNRPVNREVKLSELELNAVEDPERNGKPSVFACPECNGALWEVSNGGPERFRCRVGHSYTAENLLAEKISSFETALWEALRSLEEAATLARRMAARALRQGHRRAADRFDEVAEAKQQHAEALREILLKNWMPPVSEQAPERKTG